MQHADPANVLDWLEAANKLLVTRQLPGTAVSHSYFSPGEGCLYAIIDRIKGAVQALDICVFTISDDRISREIEFCHARKVKVRILTDNEKLYDAGSDIDRLASRGISIKVDRTESHMHHKFALIDGKVLINGSYNWTRSAQAYNQENILITHENGLVRAFSQEFERLWAQMKAYQ
jgi:mitochondrial cardiolipin hydrolase